MGARTPGAVDRRVDDRRAPESAPAARPPDAACRSWRRSVRRLVVSLRDGWRRLSRRVVGAQESAKEERKNNLSNYFPGRIV